MLKVKQFKLSFFVIIAMVFMIYSCKKNEGRAEIEPKDFKATIHEQTLKNYGRNAAWVEMPVNMPASKISYLNKEGKKILLNSNKDISYGTCGYTCANAPSALDLRIVANLLYVHWVYVCGSGNNMTATWEVSVPTSINLLLQHPGNNAYSFGGIEVVDGGGSQLAASGTLGANNFSLESLGADPNCTTGQGNHMYRLKYTWYGVSDSYFPGNYMNAEFTVYNDCANNLNNTLVIGLEVGPTWTNAVSDVFSDPCQRTDKVYINPPTFGVTYASATGNYTLCTPPGGWATTDDHQIEYRPKTVASYNWNDQTSSTVYQGVIAGTSTPIYTIDAYGGTVMNFLNMTVSSGQWLVRYRNRVTGSCTPTLGLNTTWVGPYTTEYWIL